MKTTYAVIGFSIAFVYSLMYFIIGVMKEMRFDDVTGISGYYPEAYLVTYSLYGSILSFLGLLICFCVILIKKFHA